MFFRFLKTLTCLILLGIFAGAGVQAQGVTINADPDFDGFYSTGDGSPGAWKPFRISNPGPTIWKHAVEGFPKGPSVWIYADARTFDGGIYQQVPVKAGYGYHFEVQWAAVRHDGVSIVNDVQLVRMVGIDPLGGTNPLAPSVRWSPEYFGPGKATRDLAIDEYARSAQITIFIRAQNRYPDSRNEVFIDHALLTENTGMPPIQIAPPTATLAPPATARPVSPTIARTRTATPQPLTPTLAPTATPIPTNTAEPTATRTPRATATPEPEPELAAMDLSRIAIVLGAGICMLGGGGILVLGAAFWLFKTRN